MTPDQIDDLTLRVYRARLDWDCKGDADKQVFSDIAKHGARGAGMQANRSKSYRPIVVETLVQAGLYERPVQLTPAQRTAAARSSDAAKEA